MSASSLAYSRRASDQSEALALSSRAAGPFGWSEGSPIPHDLRPEAPPRKMLMKLRFVEQRGTKLRWLDATTPRQTTQISDLLARRILRLVKQGFAVDHVFFDGIHIERDTEARLFGNLDVAVFDDILFDQVLPPAEFVAVVLNGQ